MAIDRIDCIRIKNRDMVWLNPNQLSVFLVRIVDGKISSASATLPEEPEIGESG